MMLDFSTTPSATTTTALVQQAQSLPALVARAASALAGAKTAAEVLEAMAAAAFAYDIADSGARMARLRTAGDEVLATAYRAQADALEFEAPARRSLRRCAEPWRSCGPRRRPRQPTHRWQGPRWER